MVAFDIFFSWAALVDYRVARPTEDLVLAFHVSMHNFAASRVFGSFRRLVWRILVPARVLGIGDFAVDRC